MIDSYSPYKAIVTRPWLHALGAVSSTLHQNVKYPSKGLVKEILGSQSVARQCIVAAILHKPKATPLEFAKKPLQQSRALVSSESGSAEEASCEDLERVIIDTDPEKFVQVGVQLPPHEKQALIEFLRKNVDVFSWDHLNVNPSIAPRKQPPRRSSKDHYETVKDEVTKLKLAGAIKEVFYPEWLANTVVVKKKNGKWWICVDFIDLNKTCPKDPFPLP